MCCYLVIWIIFCTGQHNVRWLGEQAWKKYRKIVYHKSLEEDVDAQEEVQEVRKTRGGVILDPDDIIKDVLDNDDFVNVGMYAWNRSLLDRIVYKSLITNSNKFWILVLRNDNLATSGNIPDELKYVLDPMYPFKQI